jgi:hypothetical protein
MEKHTGTVLTERDLEWFRDCYYGSAIHERNPYADPMRTTPSIGWCSRAFDRGSVADSAVGPV